MRFINKDLLERWINDGAIISDILISEDFARILNELPWLAGHVDFKKIYSVSASMDIFLDDEKDLCYEKINRWLEGLGGLYSEYIAFWYSEKQPSVICRKKYALENIDSAYWGVPSWNYMFGCTVDRGIVTPNYNEILCYDSSDTLFFVRPKII